MLFNFAIVTIVGGSLAKLAYTATVQRKTSTVLEDAEVIQVF